MLDQTFRGRSEPPREPRDRRVEARVAAVGGGPAVDGAAARARVVAAAPDPPRPVQAAVAEERQDVVQVRSAVGVAKGRLRVQRPLVNVHGHVVLLLEVEGGL